MSKAIRLLVIVVTVCVGVAVSTTVSPATATSTPQCIGLSICPPPPDAEGNPACYCAKSAVQEVLLTTSDGRCFVIGPGT
jgi:hypothetical protein